MPAITKHSATNDGTQPGHRGPDIDGIVQYIADIENTSKYLEIPQANLEEAARKSANYLHRIRHVLRSQLNRRNKVWSINTCALSGIRYPAGIIHWPEEIEATDIKTRRLLAIHGGFHPRFSTLRLYKRETDDK